MSKGGSGTIGNNGSESVMRADVNKTNLYVERVTIAADDGDDLAVLGVNTHDEDGGELRIERITDLFIAGDEVEIRAYDSEGDDEGRLIFTGRMLDPNLRAGGRNEDLTITALGKKWELQTEVIFGVIARSAVAYADPSAEESGDHLSGVPCIFNKDGRPDRYGYAISGQPVFNLIANPEDDECSNWTAQDMVRHVISRQRRGTTVFSTDTTMGGELASYRPYNVNVEGMTIWDAVVHIAALCGYSVVIDYGDDISLRFFKRGAHTQSSEDSGTNNTGQLSLPAVTTKPSGSGGAANISDHKRVVASLDWQMEYAGCVNKVEAVGPPEIFQDEFTLREGWDSEVEDEILTGADTNAKLSNFLKQTNPETSTNWEKYKYVGRRWILNETGQDAQTGAAAVPYDFSDLLGGSNKYAPHHRPFIPRRAELDDAGRPKDATISVTFTGRPTDTDIGERADFLDDRAGIYFADAPLISPLTYLDSGSRDSLFPTTVKVECCVAGDMASPWVTGEASNADLPIDTYGMLPLDDGFQTDNENANTATADAQALADQASTERGKHTERGTAVIPRISFALRVGDGVTNIDGRNLKVNAQIAKITWDYMTQDTELAMDTYAIDTESRQEDGSEVSDPGLGATGIDLGDLQAKWYADEQEARDRKHAAEQALIGEHQRLGKKYERAAKQGKWLR